MVFLISIVLLLLLLGCRTVTWISATLALLGACGGGESFDLTREQLLNPETCARCHPIQFRQWSGSMHAYAADDPVFLAMNQRGQEETNGELGDFCVNCHAPMAVREGATSDGLNLSEVPQELKGVTCYFCHTVDAVEGTHNNPLRLAEDNVLRGRYEKTIHNGAHRTGYSTLHDSRSPDSAAMCGACHDIVTPAGVHLERTFSEYKDSIFANNLGGINVTCSTCHMFGEDGPIANFSDAPTRQRFDHSFPGVDVALTPFPEMEAQRAAIQRDLDNAIKPRLCVSPSPGGIQIDYILDNVNVGHAWPSGSATDRRAWAQVEAVTGDTVVFSSGTVADGEAVVDSALSDPDLWQIRDFAFKDDASVAHMFWDVAEIDSQLLPPSVTADMTDPRFIHSVTRSYTVLGAAPERVSARLFIRPVGLDVIDDLIGSGHLDATIREQIPTFELQGAALEWTLAGGFGCVPN